MRCYMKKGAKRVAAIALCLFLLFLIFFICREPTKKKCLDINEDFKKCLDLKLVEYNLTGKENCDTKTYIQLIDFCKQAVVEYE